jgi:hypothetical protein
VRRFRLVTVLALAALAAAAQESQVLVESYRRNFTRAADPPTRLGVVRDAAASGATGLGPFYVMVMNHVLGNVERVPYDSVLQEMALISIDRIGGEGHAEGFPALWALFMETSEPLIRTVILGALAEGVQVGSRITVEMARYLSRQNALAGGAGSAETRVTLALIQALGAIGDPVAFEPLFGARRAGYPRRLTDAADRALRSLQGGLQEGLEAIVRDGSLSEKLDALALAIESDIIGDRGKGEIAEEALRAGLTAAPSAPDDRPIVLELRGLATEAIARLQWSEASSLVMAHFSEAILEYERGIVSEGYLASAVSAVGAMGTTEAAQRLTLYLELLNSNREKGRAVDERVVLAVVESLGLLGDKVAFADLSFAQYLDYSERVKTAARRAMQQLGW